MSPDSKAVFFSLFQEVEVPDVLPAAQPTSGWWCNKRGQSAKCTKIKKSLVRSLLTSLMCFCTKHIKVVRSFPWSPGRSGLIQTFSSQQSFTSTSFPSSLLHPGILESPPRSKAGTGIHMQNERWTYSVRCLHFKNVAPNLLFVWCEIYN